MKQEIQPPAVWLPYPAGINHDCIASDQYEFGGKTYRAEVVDRGGSLIWNGYRWTGQPCGWYRYPAMTRSDCAAFPKRLAKAGQELCRQIEIRRSMTIPTT